MQQSRRLWPRFLVLGVFWAVVSARPALAQEQRLTFEQIVGRPRGLPQLPPQGAWGQIINVTARWVVIQNHAGQQYPFAIDEAGAFLVRWPSSVDALGTQSVVEAMGVELGSRVVQVEHIDIFEGADRSLVAPTYSRLLANNGSIAGRNPGYDFLMNPGFFGSQNLLYGWAYPVTPMNLGIPSRLHVVGTAVNRAPLQLSLPGNQVATLVPPQGGRMSVSQVTRGRVSYIRKGDHAFLMPRTITPRGLVLSQFVLYKPILLRQFDPAQ